MEETKTSKTGARGIKWAYFFIALHCMCLYGYHSMNMEDSNGEILITFTNNVSIILSAIANFKFDFICIHIVYLIGSNLISIGALVLALLSLFYYKNKSAKPVVIIAIICIILMNLVVLCSPETFL